MARRRNRNPSPLRLHQAFDELRFGREKTLNLRQSLPTPEDACARAESWLRERQVARAGEVLIITGRGASSYEGVSVVRQAVLQRLHSLRRRGVVKSVHEHTPGSFVVELASVKSLREAAPRLREPHGFARPRAAAALAALEPATLELLKRVAELSLAELGVRYTEQFLEREMLQQLSRFTPSLRNAGDREAQLRRALIAAIEEHEG